MTPTPLILVVGMHRSGTSLLGCILQALGVTLPGPLLPGDTNNPEGYFERSDITALQEELLIDLQRWWPSESGLQPLPEGWLGTPRAQRAAICLRRLLKVDIAEQQGAWAIKDPRSSLLLPLWRQVADELKLPLRLLLAIRDPAEVVVSLVGRDGGPAGMTQERAEALWLRHHHQLLVDGIGLPLQVVSYSTWFSNAEPQLEALAGFCRSIDVDRASLECARSCIRPEHRRSNSDFGKPRLSRQTRRLQRKLEQAVAQGQDQSLRHWALQEPLPSPLAAETHPWSKALSALNCADIASGLQVWQQQGIPPISLDQLAELQLPGFPGEDPSCGDGPPLPQRLSLELIGDDLHDWRSHVWLDQLPLAAGTTLQNLEAEEPDATVLVQPLVCSAADPALLKKLSSRSRVFALDRTQVRLLRLLGVNAELLQSSAGGYWLQQRGDADAALSQLGLPLPSVLRKLGARWLCLGHSDHPDWFRPPAGLHQIPCFPPAPSLSTDQARLLASWIRLCLSAGLQLVRLNPDPAETQIWQDLEVPSFRDLIGPAELLEELAWRNDECPLPADIQTPKMETELLWSYTSSISPQAAICISSYNYANRLPNALESCHCQSLDALELLIVDDASTDDSVDCIVRWLEEHGQRFYRVQLLKHQQNAGLAAARNTAFASATAPWCWVLDADNQLDPKASEVCLQLAKASPDKTAVVHPLIRICNDDGKPLGLVGGGHAWQSEQLKTGNVVDAMAMIRHEAWRAVGGFSHIPGGWEDFDFWCKLIETGWHGVLYPQPLATYTRHGTSMLQSQTNQRQRQLSRLLQQRHPWLQLAFAAENH